MRLVLKKVLVTGRQCHYLLMEVLDVRLTVPDEELPDAIFTSDGLRAPVP